MECWSTGVLVQTQYFITPSLRSQCFPNLECSRVSCFLGLSCFITPVCFPAMTTKHAERDSPFRRVIDSKSFLSIALVWSSKSILPSHGCRLKTGMWMLYWSPLPVADTYADSDRERGGYIVRVLYRPKIDLPAGDDGVGIADLP